MSDARQKIRGFNVAKARQKKNERNKKKKVKERRKGIYTSVPETRHVATPRVAPVEKRTRGQKKKRKKERKRRNEWGTGREKEIRML